MPISGYATNMLTVFCQVSWASRKWKYILSTTAFRGFILSTPGINVKSDKPQAHAFISNSELICNFYLTTKSC